MKYIQSIILNDIVTPIAPIKRKYDITGLLTRLVAGKGYSDVDHCAAIVSRYFRMDSFKAYKMTYNFFIIVSK